MASPNVTVIIPAYNGAAFIKDALASVARQTYQDFEVILVDDGSTDATFEIVSEVAKDWDKLWVIRAEHGGLACARNRALSQANGQWIALLDADDLWLPNKLAKSIAFLESNPPLSVVYHPMNLIRRDGKPFRGRYVRCKTGQVTEPLFHRGFIYDPSVVFHRRVVDTVGPFDQSLPVCVGYEFWLRVSTRFDIGLINEPLALRRCHEDSLTVASRTCAARVKSQMLERFYFDRGGRDLIKNPRKALRHLARVHYQAGRLFQADRDFRTAKDYFQKALRTNPIELRTLPFLAWSWLRSLRWR
ncbi:MAG: glycosyltransferase [Phycisphaerae bacterium]|nr:glycosyltransferase [Phycisphaerae bacterium]